MTAFTKNKSSISDIDSFIIKWYNRVLDNLGGLFVKKFLTLSLAILMMLSLLACGSGSEGGSDSASKPVSGDSLTVTTDDVKFLNASGESVYALVRPDKPEIEETAKAGFLFKQFKNILGVNVKNTSDTTDGTDTYEILIGNTNRPESAAAMEYMFDQGYGRYEDFIICTIGKKIVINAHNANSLDAACKYFVENFLKKEGVSGGIKYINAMKGDFKDITVNGVNIGKFYIVRPHYNTSYITQLEIERLVDSVYKASGFMLKIKEDTYTTEGEYEIVVGNTNRKGVEKIESYDNYNITVSGNKVYLNGGNTYSTAISVTMFEKLLADGTVADADSVKNGSYATAYAENCNPSTHYRPVWYDDFDGDEVDTNKWDIISEEYAKKGDDGLSGQNGKRAWRRPENVLIYDGLFHSVFTQDEGNYYSGTLRTYTTMTYQYGYLEMSSITPKGSGFWSTLWMSSANVKENAFEGGYSMEVDIAENFGNAAVTDANAHVWPKGVGSALGYEHRSFDQIRANESKYSVQKTDGKLLSEDFHTFGFLWTEDYIAFTADGKIYCDLNINEPGFEDYKVAYTTGLVNLRLAGTCGFCNCPLKQTATDEEWATTNQFIVDYVHLFQLDDNVSKLNILK